MNYKLCLLFFCVTTTHAAEQQTIGYFDQVYHDLFEETDDERGCKIVESYTGPINAQRAHRYCKETLLHATTTTHRKRKSMALLLKMGANPNIFNADGHTSLHDVIHEIPRPDLAKLLLQHGADVNQKNRKTELKDDFPHPSPLTSILFARQWTLDNPASKCKNNPSDALIELLLESTTLEACEPDNQKNPIVQEFFIKRTERESFMQQHVGELLLPELAPLVIAYQRGV